MDVVASLPRDNSHMRELLFVLPMTFSLNLANYKLFWPLVDNIYSIRTSRPYTSGSGDYKYHYVICRFKRAYQVIPSFSQGPRATTKRIGRSSNLKL